MSVANTADNTYRARQGQGIGMGGRYARLLAPAVNGRAAVVELVVAMLLAMGLAWLVLPQNPLLLGLGFPWAWLLPVILALRYGTLIGVGSVLMLLGGWFFFQQAGAISDPFPRMFFLGGLLLVLVAGQFGDIWGTRLARARAVNRYLDERLAALTKNHYLLRISHARLENDLLARPTTLRDTLSQLRGVAQDEAVRTGQPLAGAQPMLQVVAQACQLEAAALYACDGDKIDPAPAASVGPLFALDTADPLVRHCLETRQLAHLRAEGLQHDAQTRYVAVAPVLAGSDHLIGVLVVERMPFLSLTYENLQMLMVLLGFYADGVEHAGATRAIQAAAPGCPYAFALDYARLSRLRRETGIDSSVVALVFDLDPERDALFDQVVRSRRALDVAWPVVNSHHRAMLTLMPLSDAQAVSAYLVRIEDMLRAQFGTDFTSAGIGVYTLAVPGSGSEDALLKLLHRAQVDGEMAQTKLPAGEVPHV
ncbi:PelD GGDEF domain-containing protein [Cupriavidus necator]|uniref:PelD GGDEF domain-containing protein n=1 Tax=Cupriavidus necator TaxID=106590 RepID=UPI0005B3B241|nr:PelD GGDEF domain-containing protein [Cupriavidus necator]